MQPQAEQGGKPSGRYGPQNADEWAQAEKMAGTLAENFYDDATQQIRNSDNPVETAGQIAGSMIYAAEQDQESKGQLVPDSVAEGAYKFVVEDLIEIAVEIGALPLQSQEEVNEALAQAARIAGATYAQEAMANREQPQQPQAAPAGQMPPTGGNPLAGMQPGPQPGMPA